jgi:hypothetical protein
VEETMRTLRRVCDEMEGHIHPQCRLHKDTIRFVAPADAAEARRAPGNLWTLCFSLSCPQRMQGRDARCSG